jgi:hypothetical protein
MVTHPPQIVEELLDREGRQPASPAISRCAPLARPAIYVLA